MVNTREYNNKRFSIFESEEKTALALMNELGQACNDVLDRTDKVEKENNKKVSYEELHTKYQLTTDGENANFNGSWQGLNKPTLTQEGAAAQVEKNMADIKLKMFKGNNVTVGKNNCDYKTINEALQTTGETLEVPINILLSEGIYEEQVYIPQWARKNLIGKSKKDTIIINKNGGYNDETLITAGEKYIANITFKATHEKSSTNDYTNLKAYAFHGDKSTGGDGTTLIENCRFESYQNASVGLGIYNNQKFHFKDCEFYSKIPYNSPQANIGAFFAHNNVNGGETNGQLVLENCDFYMDNDRSDYGYACYINDANLTNGDGSGNTLNVLFINCRLWRKMGEHTNCIRVDNTGTTSQKFSGSITLDNRSYGNNIADLNRPQILWQHPTLPSGVTNFNGSFAQCRFGKDRSGQVIIEGLIKGCTDSMELFTLPVGYRPKYHKYFSILSNDGSNLKTGSMIINSDGVVRVDKNIGSAFISLECTFMAEQ